jgi:hypothetical protein
VISVLTSRTLQSNASPLGHRISQPDPDGAKSSLTLSIFSREDHFAFPTWSHFPRTVRKKAPRTCGAFLLFKARTGARGRERRTARRGVGAECVPRRALSAVRGSGGSPRRPGRCPVSCRAGRAARGGCSCGTAARSTAGRSAASLCKCEGARKGKSCSQCDCGELHSGFLGLMTKGKSPLAPMFRSPSARYSRHTPPRIRVLTWQ